MIGSCLSTPPPLSFWVPGRGLSPFLVATFLRTRPLMVFVQRLFFPNFPPDLSTFVIPPPPCRAFSVRGRPHELPGRRNAGYRAVPRDGGLQPLFLFLRPQRFVRECAPLCLWPPSFLKKTSPFGFLPQVFSFVPLFSCPFGHLFPTSRFRSRLFTSLYPYT